MSHHDIVTDVAFAGLSVSLEQTMHFYNIEHWPSSHDQFYRLREALHFFNLATDFEQTADLKHLTDDYLTLAAQRENDAAAYGRFK